MKRCVGIAVVLFGILSIVSGLCEPGILVLPNDLSRIEEKAFYGDFNMQEVVLPEGVKYIGPLAFGYSGLTKINLPSSLEEIDDTAFDGISHLSATVTPGTYAANWWNENWKRFNAETKVLQVGFENSLSEPVGQGMVKWQELLAARNVNLAIELYPDSQIGNKNDLIDQMLLGESIMTLADGAFFADYGVKDMGIVFGPFLFDNWDQCWKLTESGWWNEQCAKLEGLGIKMVAANWAYGARHTLTTKPVHTAADLKNLFIRVPTNVLQTKGFAILGTIPVAATLGDVYTALQQGTIDGIENPLSTLYGRKHHEVAKYLILDGHVLNFTTWICSANWFNSLSLEQQEALIETGKEAGIYNNSLLAAADAHYCDLMESEGVTIYQPTVEDLESFRALAEDFYKLGDSFGWTPGLYETVKAAMK